jgi:hypothetical protein
MKGDSPDLIISDGNGYYAWIRSIFIDGDLDFTNDFEELYFPDPPPQSLFHYSTPKGLLPNKYPIGVAILEIPGFFVGHTIAHLTPFPTDGISLPYQVSITFSLVLLTLFSYYLFFLALQNYGINNWINLLVSSLPLIATNLIHYVAKEPGMAHASGVALINSLVFLASYKPGFIRYPQLSRLLTGVIIGLLVIVRLSNIIFLPFLIWLFHNELRYLRKLVPILLGAGMMLCLHAISLFLLWGQFVLNPYQNEGFTGNIFGLWEIVLGNRYGVFLYHPWYLVLVILNIAGLFLLKEKNFLYVTILISTLSLWLINGLWGFSGDSFGSRAFIELLPPLSLGAGITLNSITYTRHKTINLAIALQTIMLVLLNFYLWGGYLLQKYPQDGNRTLTQVYLWLLNN